MHPIQKASEILGSQAELALRLGVSRGYISQLISGHRKVPAQYCRSIESMTDGAVTRYELRSDIFGDASEAAK